MPREMSADLLAAITSQAIRPAIFVELDFTSGPDYFWSGRGTISWNGHDWLGIGSLMDVSVIAEGADISASLAD